MFQDNEGPWNSVTTVWILDPDNNGFFYGWVLKNDFFNFCWGNLLREIRKEN
jgi:hypothetical protein